MAKNKISEWSSTPANNTDVGGIDIAEGCAPSGINNAIREMMAQVKDMITGADGDSQTIGGNLVVNGTSTLTGAVSAPAGVTGSLTGNVTGNLTGNVTGNLTGNASGAASSIANSGGWNITPTGTKLFFNYNGTNVASLDSSGNFITIANVTAYGTP
jgi:hypothetical protein